MWIRTILYATCMMLCLVRHLNPHHPASPPFKKPAITSASDEKKVDPTMLQYQNHKLAQQLDHQRSEICALENKCCQFRSKQTSYDDTLIIVNRAWDLLVDNLELLAVCANAAINGLRVLESSSANKGPAVPPEETFLQRLLEKGLRRVATLKKVVICQLWRLDWLPEKLQL